MIFGDLTPAEIPVPDPTLPRWVLQATDRCDKCGGQAYYRVEFGGGLDLDFCRHCFLEREAGLRAQGQSVLDESSKLEKHIPVEPEGE